MHMIIMSMKGSREVLIFKMILSTCMYSGTPFNEDLGTMKITLLYQTRVKELRNVKSWDQQNDLVIREGCVYPTSLYRGSTIQNAKW